MKTVEHNVAIELRQNGWTYSSIGKYLGVSRGSLSRWLRSVPYVPTPETLTRRKLASVAVGEVLHHRKIERVTRIQTDAKQSVSHITQESLHLLGIMAYWAEGSKTQDALVAFTNTDPLLIQLVQRWLIECCGVDSKRLRLHIRVHDDMVAKDAEVFWRTITGIPIEQCEKTTIKESGSGGRRMRKIRHGIATIKVCDTNLHYRIRGWIEGLIANSASESSAPVAQLDRATPF